MVRTLVLGACALLWSGSALAQTVPGRFPPGTVYGNPGAVEANPQTVPSFVRKWTTAGRPVSPAAGDCGFNTSINQYECYNPLLGQAQFPTVYANPGSDNAGALQKWSSQNLIIGPMLTNPALPGGPYGSNVLTITNGTLGIWNSRPYGWSHSASALCVLSGFLPPTLLNDSQGACLVAGGYGDRAGIPAGSGAAAYNSRDMMSAGFAIYSPAALWPLNLTNCNLNTIATKPDCASLYHAGTFTATTFVPTAPIANGGRLRVGMTIDTNGTVPWSGIISSFTLDGASQITSITVPAWYQGTVGCRANQATCVAGTPSGANNDTGAALGAVNKVFASNLAATRNNQSEATQSVGIELDCNNVTGVDNSIDTMQGGPTSIYDGCYDAVNLGNARAAFAYITRGKFVTSNKIEGDLTYGIRIAPIGANVVTRGYQMEGTFSTIGYSFTNSNVGSTALRIWDGTNIWADTLRNEWRLGRQAGGGSPFTMKFFSSGSGANDGTNPDATWTYSGGAGANGGNIEVRFNGFTMLQGNTSTGLLFNNAAITAQGATADQNLILSSKGVGSIVLSTGAQTAIQGQVVHTATATERFALTGAATGGDPMLYTVTTDAQTPSLRINPLGNTIIGTQAALATNATLGLVRLPAMAGAPTGTVGSAGAPAAVIDTLNKQWCYSTGGGTWECNGAPTAFVWANGNGGVGVPIQGTVPRDEDKRAGDVFSIFDYGALCRANSGEVGAANDDDGPAINLAIEAARNVTRLKPGAFAKIVGSASRLCTVKTTIDLTSNPLAGATSVDGLSLFPGLTVEDLYIFCQTGPTASAPDGRACIDAIGSNGITWRNVNVWGDIRENIGDATATNSLTIGTGSKVVTVIPTSGTPAFPVGQRVTLISQGAPVNTNWMQGTVTSYSAGTLTINVTDTNGAGTFTDWAIWHPYFEPSVGIQIGRAWSNAGCGQQMFDRVLIDGSYSRAAFYNLACEVTQYDNIYFNNYDGWSADPYSLVMDGNNKFNLPTITRGGQLEPSQMNATANGSHSGVAVNLAAGSRTFTITAGLGFLVGDRVLATASTASCQMAGLVTSYSGTSLVVNVDAVRSSGCAGSFTAWTISGNTGLSFNGNLFNSGGVQYNRVGHAGIFTSGNGQTRYNNFYASTGFGLSTTNILVGTGSKTFTLSAPNQGFVVGQRARISYINIPGVTMTGLITAYTKTGTFPSSFTQTITVNVDAFTGTGSFANWNIQMDEQCNVDLYWFTNNYYDNLSQNIWDAHFEAYPQNNFCIKAKAGVTSPVVNGFRYATDQAVQTVNSIFYIPASSPVTSIKFNNFDIDIDNAGGSPAGGGVGVTSPVMFSDPSKFKVNGTIKLYDSLMWNLVDNFTGSLCAPQSGNANASPFPVAVCAYYPATMKVGTTSMPVGLQFAAPAVIGTGGSYVPGDRLTFNLGTNASPAILAVSKTQVRTATVQTAGTTCTNGAATLTGVSGTGTKWTANITISLNTIPTGALTVTTAGNYSANPTLTSGGETVTGSTCSVPPTVTLTMGVLAAWPVVPGVYTYPPTTQTIAQTAAPASGATGATWTPSWSFVPALNADPDPSGNLTGNVNYGVYAGASLSSGTANTFLGSAAGLSLTSGLSNVAVGLNAMRLSTTASNSVCVGVGSCGINTTSGFMTGIGHNTLAAATGGGNTALGQNAGRLISTGVNNTVIGQGVGQTTLATGSRNLLLGVGSACDTTAAGTNDQFKVCGTAADLMVGDMAAASLNLAMGGGLQLKSTVVASLPTCGPAGVGEGKMFAVTDAPVSQHLMAYCNGTNWTYIGGLNTVYGAGTATHTFQKGAITARFVGCGSGGGGGSGGKQTAGTAMAGGGAGGGGACFDRVFRIADIGASVVVVVGAAGGGGTAPGGGSAIAGVDGTAGAATCVTTSTCIAGTRYVTGGGGGFGAGSTLASASTGGGAGGCPNIGQSANHNGGNASGATAGTGCNSGYAGGSGANGATSVNFAFGSGGAGSSNAAAFLGGNTLSTGAAGGGSGGTVIAAPTGTSGNAGAGGWPQQTSLGGGAGGTSGTPTGGTGTAVGSCAAGGGGGGGYSSSTGVGSNAGAGIAGGGGGGGGAAVTTQAAGNGAPGGAGFLCVFESL